MGARWAEGGSEATIPPRNPLERTGRTAFVLRSWSAFQYSAEDIWNIRSLITEVSLANGGTYTVFLLVDVHDTSREICGNPGDNVQTCEMDVKSSLQEVQINFNSLFVMWLIYRKLLSRR